MRVAPRGLAERAVLGDERERVALALGVRGEPVRGERVGDRRDRGLHRAVPFGRFHARRHRTPVLEPDLLGDAARLVDREPFERTREQRGEQVVAAGRERELRVVGRHAVALRRPARGSMPGELDVEVPAARELLEVVAGDVGVQGEALGDLGRGHAVGRAPHEEVDVAAGRVAEGGGDRRDGRSRTRPE